MFVHVPYFVYFCRTKAKGGETGQQAQIFVKRLSTIARAFAIPKTITTTKRHAHKPSL